MEGRKQVQPCSVLRKARLTSEGLNLPPTELGSHQKGRNVVLPIEGDKRSKTKKTPPPPHDSRFTLSEDFRTILAMLSDLKKDF